MRKIIIEALYLYSSQSRENQKIMYDYAKKVISPYKLPPICFKQLRSEGKLQSFLNALAKASDICFTDGLYGLDGHLEPMGISGYSAELFRNIIYQDSETMTDIIGKYQNIITTEKISISEMEELTLALPAAVLIQNGIHGAFIKSYFDFSIHIEQIVGELEGKL